MHRLNFDNTIAIDDVFAITHQVLVEKGLTIASYDYSRPWGGFFVINELNTEQFIDLFFPHLNKHALMSGGRLSPKILVVAPHKRLSWQYHFRRAEIWKHIGGVAAVATSFTDAEGEVKDLVLNEVITLAQGQRHRLIGKNGYGIIAEIWQHSDPNNPSNEDDIVRLQDDFGR
jgi:mannose-6-phosphate isomerase